VDKRWVLKNCGKELFFQFVMEKPFQIYFSTKKMGNIHETLNLFPYVKLEQIHSNIVWKIDEAVPPESLSGDGLITSKPRIYLVVKVADCYPLYIVDTLNLSCGLFHVGWRGLRNGIVESAIEKFKEYFNSVPEKLIAIFGPGISAEHYEVGAEFKDYFNFGLIERDSRYYFDIFSEASTRLRKLGVVEIHPPPYDTFSNPEWFHSKRRDGVLLDLNSAVIGIEKEPSVNCLIEDSEYNI